VASFDKVIPPGQEGTINFEIDGKRIHEAFSKSASVSTNDPKHPMLTIAVAGKVIPYVEIQPSRQIYLSGMYGEKVSKEIIVSSNEKKKNFKITGLSSNIDDKITYSYAPDTEPGRYKITVWKNPKLPTLNTWGNLNIDTNSEHSSRTVIQVSVATRGSIICQPAQLNFGALKFSQAGALEKPVSQSLEVMKVEGQFAIKNVSFTTGDYKAKVETLEAGKRYKVDVDFAPATKKKNFYDEMIINTDDPQEPSLRIRLIARGI
jgi:hypothetical protein